MVASGQTPEIILGKEIARLRRRVGLSQEELAFRVDVHRTYISQLERGLKSPTFRVILKLSEALRISAGRLVSEVEKRL